MGLLSSIVPKGLGTRKHTLGGRSGEGKFPLTLRIILALLFVGTCSLFYLNTQYYFGIMDENDEGNSHDPNLIFAKKTKTINTDKLHLSSSPFEALPEISTIIDCYEKGRDGQTGINYYYHGGSGDCRPFPTQLTSKGSNDEFVDEENDRGASGANSRLDAANGEKGTSTNRREKKKGKEKGFTYQAPPQASSISSVVDIFDKRYREERRSSSSSGNKEGVGVGVGVDEGIVVRHTPSPAQSQWLFNDWRLWEGELGLGDCPPPPSSASSSNSSNSTQISDFVTKGSHRPTLMNNMYRLDNFCLDEDTGALIGFALPNSTIAESSTKLSTPTSLDIKKPKGKTERGFAYEPNSKMLAVQNRVVIPLTTTATAPKMNLTSHTNADAFKAVITASLNQHFASLAASPKDAATRSAAELSSPSFAPEVFFVDSPALIHPLNSRNDENPGHIMHRIGSSVAIKGVMNLSSTIFTVESVAPSAAAVFCSRVCQTRLFTPLLLLTSTSSSSSSSAMKTSSSSSSKLPPLQANIAILLALPPYLVSDEERKICENDPLIQAHGASAYLQPFLLKDFARLLLEETEKKTNDENKDNANSPLAPPPPPSASSSFLVSAAFQYLSSASGGASLPWELFAALDTIAPPTPMRSIDIFSAVLLEVQESIVSALSWHLRYNILLSSGHQANAGDQLMCEAFRCSESDGRGSDSTDNSATGSDSGGNINKEQHHQQQQQLTCADVPAYRRCASPYIAVPISAHNPTPLIRLGTQKGGGGVRGDGSVFSLLTSLVSSEGFLAADDTKGAGGDHGNTVNKAASSQQQRETDAFSAFLKHKNVTRPTQAINVDTANYSRTVWNGAVRMVFREARRIRRDILVREEQIRRRLGGNYGDGGGGGIAPASKQVDNEIEEILQEYQQQWGRGERMGRRRAEEGRTLPPPLELLDVIFDSPLPLAFSHEQDYHQHREEKAAEEEKGEQHKKMVEDAAATKTHHPFAYVFVWRGRVIDVCADHIVKVTSSSSLLQSQQKSLNKTRMPKNAFEDVRDDDFSPKKKAKKNVIAGVPQPSYSNASSSKASPKRPINKALVAYIKELFAVLLDRLQAREQYELYPQRFFFFSSSSPQQRGIGSDGEIRNSNTLRTSQHNSRKRLICYKTAIMTQVVQKFDTLTMPRASLHAFIPSNCDHREALRYVYEAMWQRYGQCAATIATQRFATNSSSLSSGSGGGVEKRKESAVNPLSTQKRQQQRELRGAHPIFTLPKEERLALQRLYASSLENVNRILSSKAVEATLNAFGGSRSRPQHQAHVSKTSSFNDEDIIDIYEENEKDSDSLFGSLANTTANNSGAGAGEREAELLLKLHALIEQIESAQQAYDDVFMSYFDATSSSSTSLSSMKTQSRQQHAISSSPTPNYRRRPQWAKTPPAPIRFHFATRSTGRAFATLRQQLSRLSAPFRPNPMHDLDGNNPNSGESANAFSSSAPSSLLNYLALELAEKSAAGMYSIATRLTTTDIMNNGSFSSISSSSLSSSSSPLNTPYARQANAMLHTDILMGPHGAELHNIAFLKGTALVHELSMADLDAGGFNGGYFGNYAFGRNVGYLRTYAHRVHTYPDPIAEKGVAHVDDRKLGGQVHLTLPDMRQLFSLDVCAWLATNSVRLADMHDDGEEKGVIKAESGGVGDYSWLVPWWCRGGSSAVVRSLLSASRRKLQRTSSSQTEAQRMGEHKKVAEEKNREEENVRARRRIDAAALRQDSRPALSLRALIYPSYYTVRMVPTAYGFVEPYCAPLHGSVTAAAPIHEGQEGVDSPAVKKVEDGDGGKASEHFGSSSASHRRFALSHPKFDEKTLVGLQNNCAVGISRGTHGKAVLSLNQVYANGGTDGVMPQTGALRDSVPESKRAKEATRLRVESLQTLLEAVFLRSATPLECQVAARLMVEGALFSSSNSAERNANEANADNHGTRMKALIDGKKRSAGGGRDDEPKWCGDKPFSFSDEVKGVECLSAMLDMLISPQTTRLIPRLDGEEGVKKKKDDGGGEDVSSLLHPAMATSLTALRNLTGDAFAIAEIAQTKVENNNQTSELDPKAPQQNVTAAAILRVKSRVVRWIAQQFMRVGARLTHAPPPSSQLMTDASSYSRKHFSRNDSCT